MTEKKVPMRRCIGCMQSKPKKELLRVVGNEEYIKLDPGGRAPGRGAYICFNSACLDAAVKKNAISRNLKMAVTREQAEALRLEFEKLQVVEINGGALNG